MKKVAIPLALAVLVFAIPSYGQTQQEYQHPLPLTVDVRSESEDSLEIKHAVDARIAETTKLPDPSVKPQSSSGVRLCNVLKAAISEPASGHDQRLVLDVSWLEAATYDAEPREE